MTEQGEACALFCLDKKINNNSKGQFWIIQSHLALLFFKILPRLKCFAPLGTSSGKCCGGSQLGHGLPVSFEKTQCCWDG